MALCECTWDTGTRYLHAGAVFRDDGMHPQTRKGLITQRDCSMRTMDFGSSISGELSNTQSPHHNHCDSHYFHSLFALLPSAFPRTLSTTGRSGRQNMEQSRFMACCRFYWTAGIHLNDLQLKRASNCTSASSPSTCRSFVRSLLICK